MEGVEGGRQRCVHYYHYHFSLAARPPLLTTTTSGLHSLINRDQQESYRKDHERPYSTMATSMVSSAPFHQSPHGPPPPYSHTSSLPATHSLSGLISPPDSIRIGADEKRPQLSITGHRQSLPSIHEALSVPTSSFNATAPAAVRPPPTPSASFPQPPLPPSSIPRSYSQDVPPNQPTPLVQPQRSPPQPLHPQVPRLPRNDGPSSYNENQRPQSISSFHNRPPSQQSPYPAPHYDAIRYEREPQIVERQDVANGYPPQHQPPPPPPSASYGEYSGSVPLVSHSQSMHPPPTPYPPSRFKSEPPDKGYDNGASPNVRQPWPSVKRHLDIFEVELCLADVGSASLFLK